MARTSSGFLERNFGLSARNAWLLGALAAAALAAYLAWSVQQNDAGFPLDDAWIHQTYARNLAQRGEWAFIPGQPSGGATSVAWVLLLAPGVWLNLAPFAWSWLLGWLALWALGLLGAAAFAVLTPAHKQQAPWVGALLIVEYHLVWAAASGMETALFAALCAAALWFSLRPAPNALAAGALAGAALLVRPEGVTLLGPLGVALALTSKGRVRIAARFFAGFLLLLLPYLLFNQAISGSWWPSTFYAKQAEYAELLATPFAARFSAQAAQPLIGAGLFLLPGFFYYVYGAVRGRDWRGLAWLAWLLGFLLLFALRLPVTYQHGRYAMPVLPVYLVLGAAGMAAALRTAAGAWGRRLAAAWSAAVAFGALAFYVLGGGAYARDVAFIESQMVATARWVAVHTQADARVAAHDIGALGYFAPRPLVDLAGLVSPDVVPFIRNEERLAAHLDAVGAQYLIVFPDWYARLSAGAELLYQAPTNPAAPGAASMGVYRWQSHNTP